ncbi:MAG: replicative DNA helicase [Planctomycetota bacterium]|nr:replicative DNA helicase [Planctomycetota bacterium]
MAAGSENPFERIPPHDEASEAGVLGAMLCDESAASIAVETLKPEDFYVPRHQILFTLFAELHQQQPDLDLLFVQSELDKRGLTERVGGKQILTKLVQDTPTAANVERYCRIVKDRAIERELLNSAAKIVSMVGSPRGNGEDASDLLEQAEGLIFNVAERRVANEPVTIQSVLEGILTEADTTYQARKEGREIPSPAIATGFHDLDRMFAGGMWPGEVIIIAARPSVGKTTLAINIARKVACRPREKHPVGVAIFSMEMPKEQVSKNLLCSEAKILSSKMRKYEFDEDEYDTVRMAAEQLKQAPIFIDDTPGLSTSELRARARRLYHREGVRMLLIDYLQLMTASKNTDSREQAVAELSRQVKQIARELNIPVVLLSQLRRPIQGKEDDSPKLTDLRESGSIEQDADVVIMLHRTLDDKGVMTRDIRAIVQKNRNGEIGEVQLSFFPEYFRFETYTPDIGSTQSAAGD